MSSPEATVRSPKREVGGFRGDVLRLATGTGIGQLIGILAAPIVTRLFSPEAYGVAALFASMTAILGVLACARYELAIVLPDEDSEAANLFWLSGMCATAFALLSCVAVWLGGPLIVTWINAPQLSPYLWILPLAIFLRGLFAALNYWNTRTGHFARLSFAEITSRVFGTSAVLGAGFAGHTTGGAMIAASVGGSALATTVLGGQIFREDGRFLLKSFDRRKIVAGIKRYRKFPMYSSWSGLINIASWQLPILLLGIFFSPAIVGFYALGFRILQMPMSLIGRAIGKVFHQRAAQANLRGDLEPLVRNLLRTLVIVGLAPISALAVIGEDLFSLVFGPTWSQAGIYTQILSPWAFVWFVSSPLSTLFGVLNKQAQGLRLQITIFVSRLISLGIGAYYENVILALALFSVTGILVYGNLVYQIVRLSRVKLRHLLDTSLKRAITLSLALFSILVAGKVFLSSPSLLLCLGFLLTTAYYFFVRKDLAIASAADPAS